MGLTYDDFDDVFVKVDELKDSIGAVANELEGLDFESTFPGRELNGIVDRFVQDIRDEVEQAEAEEFKGRQ